MNAAELREALQTLQLHLLTNRQLMLQAKNVLLVEAIKRTGDAARTIALPILEADPELRRRLFNLVINHDALSITEEWAFVDKILATLINTDEESE